MPNFECRIKLNAEFSNAEWDLSRNLECLMGLYCVDVMRESCQPFINSIAAIHAVDVLMYYNYVQLQTDSQLSTCIEKYT
jgi:hypothetical protein